MNSWQFFCIVTLVNCRPPTTMTLRPYCFNFSTREMKQYGRTVLVVGGRQFTSVTMQKNCHEFIAYENLAGTRGGRPAGRGGAKVTTGSSSIEGALPLVRRALQVLSDRELTPQLGLLKSTLLQLDSTFSEREYGAGSFRDFMEKVAAGGAVT